MNTRYRLGIFATVVGSIVVLCTVTWLIPTQQWAPGLQTAKMTSSVIPLPSDDPIARGLFVEQIPRGRGDIELSTKQPEYRIPTRKSTHRPRWNSVYPTSPSPSNNPTPRRPVDAQSETTKCEERKRVALVKVHNTASTTITSILQRFGYTRNLTFALPRRDVYHIGMYETFHPKNVLPIPNGSVYEIVCQHVVFNKEAFKRHLPPDINIIASVRQPTERFVSAFMFFPEYTQAVRKKVNSTDALTLMREYLKDPEIYEPFPRGSLAINRMSFDLGIPKSQYRNCSYVTDYIKMLDDSMTFVLVADKFDESLVILKRRMCWSTKDILYKVQIKGRRRKFRIPMDIRTAMQISSPSDFKIYEYFSKKLNKIVATEIRLIEEVNQFRKTLRIVEQFCNNVIQIPNLKLTVGASEYSEAFTFDETDCLSLRMTETIFVNRLIRTQVPRS